MQHLDKHGTEIRKGDFNDDAPPCCARCLRSIASSIPLFGHDGVVCCRECHELGDDAPVAAANFEVFGKWLNAPTLEQRFDNFKSRIAALVVEAEAEGVRHVFDCDSIHGPCAIILHQDGDTTVLNEHDEDDDIRGAFETEVFDVGRAVLGGRAEK